MLDLVTDYPLWLLFFWLPLSIGLAYWLYRPSQSWLKELANWKRYLMFSLRASSLFIIGVLLLGLLIETLSTRKEKPILINLIDNSSSMLNYADSIQVKNELPNHLRQSEEQLQRFDIINIYLKDTFLTDENKMQFAAPRTNLYRLFDDVYENYYGRNIGAIQLISDGNFNTGGNPLSLRDKFNFIPIYTLGVGDTIRKKDLLIRSVIHNDIAFLGNTFPVEVTIEGDLVNELKTNIKIVKNDKIITEQQVQFPNQDFYQTKLTFMLTADAVGFQDYKVVLAAAEGESNYENNEKTFYLEIIDSRSKLLLVSGGLHPDIGAIRGVLASDDNLEVESTRLSEFTGELKDYDLIIWHEPGLGNTRDFTKRLKESKKPVWYIIGTRSSNDKLNNLPAPLIARFSDQHDNIGAQFNRAFGKFELSDKTQQSLNRFPPLVSPYGKLEINGPVDVLFIQRLGTITKEDPLFFFGSQGETKYGVLVAEGLWRWKLANYQLDKNNDAFNEIVKKTVQYLSIRTNTSKLRIQLPPAFYEDEAITANATFYNDSYEPITTPSIGFKLTKKEGGEQSYKFIPSRSEYALYLGNLEAGVYEWEAAAEFEGKSYQKSGAFVVKRLELESLDSRANHNLLFQLAEMGDNGGFYTFSQRNELLNEIANREDIKAVGYETFSFKNLLDYKWLFFLLVLFFTAEWFLRRYNGSY
jgi:hypothetical protein